MSSPYRSAHIFSPISSPRDKNTKHTESIGTSVNIATAFSASRNNGFNSLNRNPAEEDDDEEDYNNNYLDINNIDHEAIRNDPELRELSRNPSAFNNASSNLNDYYSMKHTHYRLDNEQGEEDQDDDDYGEYKDVELLVRNPLEEKRQRQLVSQISNLSSVQNVPISPAGKFNSFLSSSSTAFDNEENDKSMERTIADSLHLQDGDYQSFYLILKPIAFILFMAFWIIKEPIIRTVTFFTMIVSTVIVDPLFYLWSQLPNNDNNNKKWIPGTDIRKRFTHWCTASLLVILSIYTIKQYYPDQSFVPAWATAVKSNLQFNMPLVSPASTSLNTVERQQLKMINNEYKLLASRFNKFHDQFKDYTKGADNEYTKIRADANNEYSKLWTAINNQQAQINALHDKLDVDLRKVLTSKQQKLPDTILVPTDKDNKFEVPADFYEYLHNADSWDQFLKNNKAAINKYVEGEMAQFFEKQEKNGAIISKDAFLSLITNDLVKRSKGKSAGSGLSDDSATLSLNDLVESAVEKYHQDMLDTADFALESRGGHVIFTKTSSTFETVSPWIQRLRKTAGLSVLAHPPELAIRPETHVGECWSMVGNHGTLGILLSEPIMIQSVTIEHPSKNILLQDIDSAPKDIEIYGVGNYGIYGQKEELISLGRVYYDINTNKPVQTFTVNSNPTDSYRSVLVKIKSNWGNSDHTDIYRIRVHGIPL